MELLTQDKGHGDTTAAQAQAAALKRYPETIRQHAIAAVQERRGRNPRDRTIYREIAHQFQVGEQSLRLWVKKHDAEAGTVPQQDEGDQSAESMRMELEAMRQKIEQLQAENEVLKRAFVVFSAEWSK